MRNYLPSMSSLRAFEAAARHLSFTRAAQELNLTQTAISHRIRKLEELLGAKLFIRNHGMIGLTEAARIYLPSVREHVSGISEATDRAMDRKRSNSLYIGSMATFATKCLVPGLRNFADAHPEVSLRLGIFSSAEGLARRDYDVTIRYGTGDWPGLESDKLCDDNFFPVCSPKLPGIKKLKRPADLRNFTIIRTAASSLLQDDWQVWLDQAGVGNLESQNQLTCDMLVQSIDAASAGLGVAMGRDPLVSGGSQGPPSCCSLFLAIVVALRIFPYITIGQSQATSSQAFPRVDAEAVSTP